MPVEKIGGVGAVERGREFDALERRFYEDIHAIAASLDVVCAALLAIAGDAVVKAERRAAAAAAGVSPPPGPGSYGAGHD